MQAGRLRHRGTLQQRSAAQGAFGEQSDAWVDLEANVAMDVQPLTGSQRDRTMATFNETTHEVSLRYRADLADVRQAGAYRILFGTRILDIQAARNVDERGREHVLMCKEGLNNGQ